MEYNSTMPFPNFHSARQEDPGHFLLDSFRTIEWAPGIEAVLGKKPGSDALVVQTIRFDKDKFTTAYAEQWLTEHGYSTGLFEPAKEAVAMKALDVAEIKNVEILDRGIWSGNKRQAVTDSDMDQMIANFKAGVVEPFLTLDHNDGYTDKVKAFLKVASLGWVSDLRRSGSKLVADFKQVPAKIAELIQSGTLKKRSVEFYPKGVPYRTNGKTFENVLTAVTFFGADKPAVNSLRDDFEVLMLTSGGKRTENEGAVVLQEKITQEKRLSKVKFTKEHLDKLKSHLEAAKSCMEEHMQAEGEGGEEVDPAQEGEEVDIANQIKSLAEQLAAIHAEMAKGEKAPMKVTPAPVKPEEGGEDEGAQFKDLQKELAELRKFKADSLESAKKAEETEAAAWVESQVKVGKVLPKARAICLKNYMSAKAESAEDLALFKEDVENRPDAVDFEEVDMAPEGEPTGKHKVTFKNTDELNAEVERVMKAEKVDFMAALEIVEGRVNAGQE